MFPKNKIIVLAKLMLVMFVLMNITLQASWLLVDNQQKQITEKKQTQNCPMDNQEDDPTETEDSPYDPIVPTSNLLSSIDFPISLPSALLMAFQITPGLRSLSYKIIAPPPDKCFF